MIETLRNENEELAKINSILEAEVEKYQGQRQSLQRPPESSRDLNDIVKNMQQHNEMLKEELRLKSENEQELLGERDELQE